MYFEVSADLVSNMMMYATILVTAFGFFSYRLVSKLMDRAGEERQRQQMSNILKEHTPLIREAGARVFNLVDRAEDDFYWYHIVQVFSNTFRTLFNKIMGTLGKDISSSNTFAPTFSPSSGPFCHPPPCRPPMDSTFACEHIRPCRIHRSHAWSNFPEKTCQARKRRFSSPNNNFSDNFANSFPSGCNSQDNTQKNHTPFTFDFKPVNVENKQSNNSTDYLQLLQTLLPVCLQMLEPYATKYMKDMFGINSNSYSFQTKTNSDTFAAPQSKTTTDIPFAPRSTTNLNTNTHTTPQADANTPCERTSAECERTSAENSSPQTEKTNTPAVAECASELFFPDMSNCLPLGSLKACFDYARKLDDPNNPTQIDFDNLTQEQAMKELASFQEELANHKVFSGTGPNRKLADTILLSCFLVFGPEKFRENYHQTNQTDEVVVVDDDVNN